jgi:hypothetical protein
MVPVVIVTPTEAVPAVPLLALNVILALPEPTAVTVNGPVPDDGDTVATAVLLERAVNVPLYPVSATVRLFV